MIQQLVEQTGAQIKEYNIDQLVVLLEILYKFSPYFNISRLLPGFERR